MRTEEKRIVRPVLAGLGLTMLSLVGGCGGEQEGKDEAAGDVVIDAAGMEESWKNLSGAITDAPAQAMNGPGLAGVMGGARVKLMKDGMHELWLPCPQIDAGLVPVSYAITTVPPDAGKEFRFRERDGGNRVVVVKLEGKKGQEVRIEWAAELLVAGKPFDKLRAAGEEAERAKEYLKSSGCAQSDHDRIAALAGELWNEKAGFEGYARAIQEHIRKMEQERRPRSMDAVGILESGANWICTANANLAAALMRAKGVPARSLAVVPTKGQKLEMHRVVECFNGGRWVAFDPSSLQPAIPLQPWHGVVMARTTIADEEQAMKPRIGVSVGCPVGQELEFTGPGIAFAMPDFFWTTAKPLKEYEPAKDEMEEARGEWERFSKTGERQ